MTIKFSLLLVLFFLACPESKSQAVNDSFRVMTYNIKFDDTNDKINNWNNRKDDVVGLLKYHGPDLIGIQEGLQHQLEYMKEGLSGYDYIGIGRDGGQGKGEYSAIFYSKEVFELLESNTFWLSENPGQVGKSWDAALPRICTWGRFVHKKSGQHIFYFNTHFDHIGETARLESARLILSEIGKLKKRDPSAKVILTGDFNFTPDAEPYQVLIRNFTDAQNISKLGHYGPQATFNGFYFNQLPEKRIDYIFIQSGLDVLKHATLTDSRNMKYPSDHFPVIAELMLKN